MNSAEERLRKSVNIIKQTFTDDEIDRGFYNKENDATISIKDIEEILNRLEEARALLKNKFENAPHRMTPLERDVFEILGDD